MTNFLKASALVLGFFMFQGSAWAADLVCSNGEIDEVGDTYFRVEIFEDGIEIAPYEGRFVIDASEASYESDVITVTNKIATGSAEGEEISTVINAALILNKKEMTLQAAISYDKGPFWSYELNCSLL